MIDAETRAFLEGTCSLIAAVVTDDGAPVALRCWGLSVEEDDGEGALVRVGIDQRELDHLRGPVDRGAGIAVTGTDVPTLRGCQVKGRLVAVEPGTPDDRARLDRYCRDVFGIISQTDDIPIELLVTTRPEDVVGCLFRATELYDQTPGPGAGQAIAGRR